MLTLKDLVDNGYTIEKIEKDIISYSIPKLEDLTFDDLKSMNYEPDYNHPNVYDTEVTNSLLVFPQDRFNVCELTSNELAELCEKHDNINEFDEELLLKFGNY